MRPRFAPRWQEPLAKRTTVEKVLWQKQVDTSEGLKPARQVWTATVFHHAGSLGKARSETEEPSRGEYKRLGNAQTNVRNSACRSERQPKQGANEFNKVQKVGPQTSKDGTGRNDDTKNEGTERDRAKCGATSNQSKHVQKGAKGTK